MKRRNVFSILAIFAFLVAAITAEAQPYQTQSIGQGRYFFYPNNSAKQDTLANADTIIYHVPFKVTDLNRYELKIHNYAVRLTGTETVTMYVQQQLFLDNGLEHWINTDTISMGALGAGQSYNAITTTNLVGTRVRLYVLGSGTTSSAAIRWQGVLRRKDAAEN
jgi:hypothetical protein